MPYCFVGWVSWRYACGVHESSGRSGAVTLQPPPFPFLHRRTNCIQDQIPPAGSRFCKPQCCCHGDPGSWIDTSACPATVSHGPAFFSAFPWAAVRSLPPSSAAFSVPDSAAILPHICPCIQSALPLPFAFSALPTLLGSPAAALGHACHFVFPCQSPDAVYSPASEGLCCGPFLLDLSTARGLFIKTRNTALLSCRPFWDRRLRFFALFRFRPCNLHSGSV